MDIQAGAEASSSWLRACNHVSIAASIGDTKGEDGALALACGEALRAVLEAWSPDCAVLVSREYADERYTSGGTTRFADSSCMVYLGAELAPRVVSPREAIAEPLAGGLLLKATDGLFTPASAEQRAAAAAIRAAVAPLGL